MIKKYLVLPVEHTGNRLKVVIHDPMDLETLDNLRFRMNCEIDTALAARSKIKEYITRHIERGSKSVDDAIRAITIDEAKGSSIDVKLIKPGDAVSEEEQSLLDAQQAPIIKLVNQIIAEAVNSRASDIHIEPMADRVRLRYRIDGVCVERDSIPKGMQSAVIARIKIMAGMNIAEKRVPQDGRIKMQDRRRADRLPRLRLPGLPRRERRAAYSAARHRSASAWPTWACARTRWKSSARSSSGPTASSWSPGRPARARPPRSTPPWTSSTGPTSKIITAEDPVEYNFKGINQCQVNEQIGLTFARDPARHAAPGAQHHPGRRNPRQGSRRSRHSGRPDRPPGLLHAAHQRRALGASRV